MFLDICYSGADGGDAFAGNFHFADIECIDEIFNIGVIEQSSVKKYAVADTALRTAGNFFVADEDIISAGKFSSYPQFRKCFDDGNGEVGKVYASSFLKIGDIAVIYISEVVIDSTSAGISAGDIDIVGADEVGIYFCQSVLVSADNDGGRILPEKEQFISYIFDKQFLQCQIECTVSCPVIKKFSHYLYLILVFKMWSR